MFALAMYTRLPPARTSCFRAHCLFRAIQPNMAHYVFLKRAAAATRYHVDFQLVTQFAVSELQVVLYNNKVA